MLSKHHLLHTIAETDLDKNMDRKPHISAFVKGR